MECDALESAAMRHGLDAEDGEDAATGDSPTQVDVTIWREIARVEAQSLLKLNEEGSWLAREGRRLSWRWRCASSGSRRRCRTV